MWNKDCRPNHASFTPTIPTQSQDDLIEQGNWFEKSSKEQNIFYHFPKKEKSITVESNNVVSNNAESNKAVLPKPNNAIQRSPAVILPKTIGEQKSQI